MRITVGFMIFFVLTALVTAALLELGRNTLWGWGLFALALAGYFVLRGTVLVHQGFIWRLLGFLAFVLVFAGIFRLSGPPVRAVPAVSHKNPTPTGVVTVAQGH